jgi:transposase
MLSRVLGSLVSIAHFSEKSTKKNGRGDTVADAINSRVRVPLTAKSGAMVNSFSPSAQKKASQFRTGHTDMRRGMNTLALMVQETLRRNPHGGDLYVFRGKSGKLIKVLWHDGLGMSLYLKRPESGRFVWPQTSDGAASITRAAR